MVWRNFPGNGAKLNVLQAIAEMANEAGNFYASMQTLAERSRVSPSTVFVAVKALRRDRWIVTDRFLGQGGVLVFQLNLPKLDRANRLLAGFDLAESDAARACQKAKKLRERR